MIKKRVLLLHIIKWVGIMRKNVLISHRTLLSALRKAYELGLNDAYRSEFDAFVKKLLER